MRYEPALDGLRAVAIVAVVLAHCTPWLPGGWTGVDIFFVISGYLITRLLAAERAASGRIDLRRFYIRRCLRLMPAFAVLMLFQLAHAAVAPHNRADVLVSIAVASTYMMDWNLAFGWFPADIIGHTWSLSIEEQFYLLWPLTLVLTRGRVTARWLLAAAVVVALWRLWLVAQGEAGWRTYMGFDTHADPLLLGCAAGLLATRPGLAEFARKTSPAAALAVLAMLFLLPTAELFVMTVAIPLAGVLATWTLLAATQDGWLKRLLSLPPLTYTGRLSYSWYLWHFPVLFLFRSHMPLSQFDELAVAASTYPIAMASYHFVERPFLRLKARFGPARNAAATRSAAVPAAG
jgi:peptidoglycan/LPS O-acetylase OafA/YrhL